MASYICGYINVKTDPYTVVEAESWDENVFAYEGYSWLRYNGLPGYGCKGKLDYQGRYWFFAYRGDPDNPDVLYLCRATKTDDTITIVYAPIPEFDEQYVPRPNQLTVDKNGFVFFPAGKYKEGTITYPALYSVDARSEDSEEWVFNVFSLETQSKSGCIGIALNKSHTKLVTFVSGVPEIITDRLVVFLNNGDGTISYSSTLLLGSTSTTFAEFPDNIETDVSGGVNDNYSFLVFELDKIIGYNMDTNNGEVTQDDYCGNRIAIQSDGVLLTTYPIVLGVEHEIRRYNPHPSIGGMVVYDDSLTIDAIGAPTHLTEHIDGTTRYIPTGTGEPTGGTPASGSVHNSVTDTIMYNRNNYRYPSVAAKREVYSSVG